MPATLPRIAVHDAVNPACVAAVDRDGTNSSEHWRCLLAENAAQHIESRIFPLEQLWGVFGSFCLVNSYFTNDTAFHTGLSCDMGGRSHHSMHACVEYGWECSSLEFTALVLPFQQHVLDSFSSLPFLHKSGNGAFMHSCHTGDEDMLGEFYNTIRVLPSNRTAQQAISQWWNSAHSAPPLWEPPCLWNDTFAPVRVYGAHTMLAVLVHGLAAC